MCICRINVQPWGGSPNIAFLVSPSTTPSSLVVHHTNRIQPFVNPSCISIWLEVGTTYNSFYMRFPSKISVLGFYCWLWLKSVGHEALANKGRLYRHEAISNQRLPPWSYRQPCQESMSTISHQARMTASISGIAQSRIDFQWHSFHLRLQYKYSITNKGERPYCTKLSGENPLPTKPQNES
jgi:hypothetical protein